MTREQMASVLRGIAMADKTTYEHHEKRHHDGKRPEPDGTIWMTPREMALAALRSMGEETTSLYWPFKASSPTASPTPDTERR